MRLNRLSKDLRNQLGGVVSASANGNVNYDAHVDDDVALLHW